MSPVEAPRRDGPGRPLSYHPVPGAAWDSTPARPRAWTPAVHLFPPVPGGPLRGPPFPAPPASRHPVGAFPGAGPSASAPLHDSAGDDTLVSTLSSGTLSGPGFSNSASYFEWVTVSASAGGYDTAD